MSPKYPLRDRLKLFVATVTPSLLHASVRYMDDEEQSPDNTSMDGEDDHTDTEKTGRCPAAAHAANVNEIVDGEPHDPDSEPKDNTTESHAQDLNEHADSNPFIDDLPNVQPEDELETWVDYIVRATHQADDLLAAHGISSRIPRQSRIHRKRARMIAKHPEGRWTKLTPNWNPVI